MDQKITSDASDNEMLDVPPDVPDEKLSFLRAKSAEVYEKHYNLFVEWCDTKQIKEYTENVLLSFFYEKAIKYKSSTLWSMFSMLKATLLAKNNVNIGNYSKLTAFLKQQNIGYQAKKSKVFTKADIKKFLSEAPDNVYLMYKVCLIFGIAGACRRQELRNIYIDNVDDRDDILIIKIPEVESRKSRIFTITDDICEGVSALAIYRRYVALRPTHVSDKTFFICFRHGRCFNQVVGIHTFAKIPSQIAKYLKLADTNDYTGHCFRRTSAALLCSHRREWRPSRRPLEPDVKDSVSIKNALGSTNGKENGNASGSTTISVKIEEEIKHEDADVKSEEKESIRLSLVPISQLKENKSCITVDYVHIRGEHSYANLSTEPQIKPSLPIAALKRKKRTNLVRTSVQRDLDLLKKTRRLKTEGSDAISEQQFFKFVHRYFSEKLTAFIRTEYRFWKVNHMNGLG